MNQKNVFYMIVSVFFLDGCFHTIKLEKTQSDRIIAYKTVNAIFYMDADDVLQVVEKIKNNEHSPDSLKTKQKVVELKALKSNDTMEFVENSGFGTFQLYIQTALKSNLESGKVRIYDIQKKKMARRIYTKHEKNLDCDWIYFYNAEGRNELWFYAYNCPQGHF